MKIPGALRFALTIVVTILLFSGCGDEPSCPDNREEYRAIDEWARSRIPYNGSDTLRFITHTKDTLEYYGKGKDMQIDIEMQHLGEPVCNSFNKIKHEAFSINFQGNDSIVLRQTNHSATTGGLSIHYSGVNFSITDIAVSNKVFTIYSFYDSLLINGKNYYDVSGVKKGQDSIYLNKNDGILIIKLHGQSKELTIIK